MQPQIDTGTVEGTGSAINISLGWKPDYVRVWNEDHTNVNVVEWFSTMTDDHGLKNINAGSPSKITSGGITPYDGDDTTSAGFTIGTDADLNVDSETIHWVAMRKGPGSQ
jgi:hypothetical protein